jgi:hypothetical protein
MPLLEIAKTSGARCPACGLPVEPVARFCGSCGARLTLVNKPAKEIPAVGKTASQRIGKLVAQSVISILVLTAGAVAAWYCWGVEVDLITNPGAAQVTVDGKSMGSSDGANGAMTIAHLSHGTHIFSVSSPDREDTSETITLPWYEFAHALQINLLLSRYPLTVLTLPPETTVQLDGKSVGVSGLHGDLVLPAVTLGEHTLLAFRDGYPTWSGAVNVQGPMTFSIDLTSAASAQQQEIGSILQRVEQLFEQSQFDEAESECRALLLKYPGNSQVLNMMQRRNAANTNAAEQWASQSSAKPLGTSKIIITRQRYPYATKCCAHNPQISRRFS